ncbi:endonuclease/exonuclease/phosphatase family protein [Bdellovibrio sp. HCB337]|uniref:endonuclease/exonuclease/phosphatase family protein n=1 Tax=Bdellovibrio sp. HCB337 TaxID=3394358 RepID=UPI0039A5B3B3
MKKLLSFLTISLALYSTISLTGCGTPTTKEAAPPAVVEKPKAPGEISIMNFNVENLFDNIHDENREDYAYMPVAKKQTPEHKAVCDKIPQPHYRDECMNFDWNDDVVNVKLKNVAQIIMGVDGQGPDILVMQEVENDRILGRLNKEYLAKAGYQTQELIEGPDTRGIDIGILSRFPMVGKPKLHKIPYVPKTDQDKIWMFRSRGILEVTLKLPTGENLTVLGAHFPSQANPTYWREQSVAFLSKLIKEKSAKGMVVASGDLNITHTEEDKTRFFSEKFSEVAMVSHLVGCQKCEGTHNYRQDWSFLDVQLFSKNLGEQGTAPYKLDTESIKVINSDPIHLLGKIPKRFKPETKEGVADHFPLYSRLAPRAAATPAATPAAAAK